MVFLYLAITVMIVSLGVVYYSQKEDGESNWRLYGLSLIFLMFFLFYCSTQFVNPTYPLSSKEEVYTFDYTVRGHDKRLGSFEITRQTPLFTSSSVEVYYTEAKDMETGEVVGIVSRGNTDYQLLKGVKKAVFSINEDTNTISYAPIPD